MSTLKTPGVYIREVEIRPPHAVRLGVTGFVGAPPRGPVHSPQLVTSWGQYQEIFDDFTGSSYLPFAVFGFFLNGGERCYITRTCHESAQTGEREIHGGDVAVLRVKAANPGAWSGAVTVAVDSSAGAPLVLTTLAQDVAPHASQVFLEHIDGLAEQDEITIIDPANPLSRRTYVISEVSSSERRVTLVTPAAFDYPRGSKVLARGFRLTFDYSPESRAARREVFDNLTMIPSHERYFARVINGDPEERDDARRLAAGLSILVRVTDLRLGLALRPRPGDGGWSLQGGSDAATSDSRGLSAKHYTGYEWPAYFKPFPAQPDLRLGLAASEGVEEIGAVAIPDLILPDLYAAIPASEIPPEGIIHARFPEQGIRTEQLRQGQRDMIRYAVKMGDRFAILDPPLSSRKGEGEQPVEEWAEQYTLMPGARNAALYWPWLRHRPGDFDGRDVLIPPSGHMAGLWAGVEVNRGPAKTPANTLPQGVIDLQFCITDLDQEDLNVRGVNCLRVFPGRGLRVWGGRTLSSDPSWMYVNVRRLYHFVVKSILLNLRWTVFEPNTPALWARVTATLKPLLQELFRQGAFAGALPAESYFIQCDAQTNPPESIERGEMVTRIGFAPAEPAEFIVVTIRRGPESFTVTEAG